MGFWHRLTGRPTLDDLIMGTARSAGMTDDDARFHIKDWQSQGGTDDEILVAMAQHRKMLLEKKKAKS